jgi:hypothetical protein
MGYEQKDNSGSLFKNDRREKDTHAHAKGTALIDGVEYWVDAWTNEARDGSKYQSLKFKRKDTAHRVADVSRSLPASSTPIDATDSVPF